MDRHQLTTGCDSRTSSSHITLTAYDSETTLSIAGLTGCSSAAVTVHFSRTGLDATLEQQALHSDLS